MDGGTEDIMEKHVTDLKTSIKLEAVGVNKFGKFIWIKDVNGKDRVIESDMLTALALHHKGHDYEPHPAYLLSELLDMVEGDWQTLEWFKGWGDGAFWFKTEKRELPFKADTPIAAVAQAVIWQKEGK